MKLLISLLTILILTACSTEMQNRISQDFLVDLGSENNRMAGDLSLDYFNEDLTKLTYDYYLTFITKHEAPSAKGFSSIVKNADYHYFQTTKDAFTIALYYKDERTIVCDNSSTSFYDSVHIYSMNDTIPELSNFVSKIKFKK